MAHDVALEDTFRGPMDLLLHLVKRDEIDIHDIPIARLTKEYLAELDRMRELDIELAGDFVAMAAMLMEIKSRMLLPPAEPVDGEEEEDFDPRAGLVQALLEYKRFKEAAAELGELQAEQARRFERFAPLPESDEGEIALESLGAADLLTAFNKMVRSLLTSQAVEIVSDEVPTEVRLEQILEAVEAAGGTRFSRLLSSEPTKGEMVGFFIALMELIRLHLVRAWQIEEFGDIHIETWQAPVPESRTMPTGLRHARCAKRPPPVLFAPRAPSALQDGLRRPAIGLFPRPGGCRRPQRRRRFSLFPRIS